MSRLFLTKGEMPEWSIGAVSKTVERFAFQGFESLSFRVGEKPVRVAGWLLCFSAGRKLAFESAGKHKSQGRAVPGRLLTNAGAPAASSRDHEIIPKNCIFAP